ncbi:MAG: hypothetical protein OXI30_10500, partial [Chloroflexota bacterium]|nr:hypothetical protein [Chloroflexota bacterium]
MHIAINGWFYDQESTGSGQYLRHLIKHLPTAAEELELSLILPNHVGAPKELPSRVKPIKTGSRSRASK